MLELHLGIQKIRFADKFFVEYSIEPCLQNAYVPTMILQPLVENSIKYAVENSTIKSKITIDATGRNGELTLVIKDQGPLCDAPFKKGIGISNSEERLEKLYGEDHYFSIKPYSDEQTGTEVIIKIPLRYA